MAGTIKIMCVHGLGDQRNSGWEDKWRKAIEGVPASRVAQLEFRFVRYDRIFENTTISFFETMGALVKLAKSGVSQIGGRRERGLFGSISDRLRWTAGYVVAWVEDKGFQAETRKLVLDAVADFKPDVILAHSLGSLITYNALSHPDAAADAVSKALKQSNYVTFGSQIGNPFVLGNLTHGRVQRLAVKHWHHLYNEHDDVFTARLNVPGAENFTQLLTPFDLPGSGDHDAAGYLEHRETQRSFWDPLFADNAGARVFGGRRDPFRRAAPKSVRKPRRRALLIGIDQYPNPADCLAGCVNDVFSMSATLQDCGFLPDEIRICLNNRATAEGILSRMAWLVDDARDGDQIVLYFSGHGTRMPEYGAFEEPDRLTETLVPYDFDWSSDRSVSDEQIFALYSQLPYGVQFVMIFDCCHAGSMHRQGTARPKAITPPDDIRHRELKWDRKEQMWVERDFKKLNRKFSGKKADNEAYFGKNGFTVRMGRAGPLRIESKSEYDAAVKASSEPVGPYLPLIIEACGEDERSYEYRHGATSYGAFTFCLTSILRQEKEVTFRQLVELARERLERLGYKQTPQILGPRIYLDAPVPFETGLGGAVPSGSLPGSATPRTSG